MTICGVRLGTTVGVDTRTTHQAASKKGVIKVDQERRRWHQIAIETRTYPTGRHFRNLSGFAAKDKRNCECMPKFGSRSPRYSSWLLASDQKVRPPETDTR